MEIVVFEPEQAFGVVIHDGPTETSGRATFEAESPERTLLTISAEFPDMNESMQSLIKGLMERSAQNIKHLIESET
jgi:hypothetical protein